MSCSLTYDDTLSRVRVSATGLDVTGTATYATVERSDDAGSTFKIVRGGSSVPVSGGATQISTDDYEFPTQQLLVYRTRGYTDGDVLTGSFTCEITVDQPEAWLKSVERPFLNRPLDCVLNPAPFSRTARNGVWDVIGRSFPVATTDVRLGFEFELRVVTTTYDEQQDLDYLLASGDVLYLQPTASFPVATMFALSGSVSIERPVRNRDCDSDYRRFIIPLVQVATPESDIVGLTSSWFTVIKTYATWQDVIDEYTSWADLLELVADPSEVIIE